MMRSTFVLMPAATENAAVSDPAETAPPTACNPPTDARASRLAKLKREQLIVDYLNRGVSVAEIAARIGVGEKRTRALMREILARRMPHPPMEFVAIQVNRLNEALLVAYSAMSPANLKAVDQVVKIVRELDRYGGAFAGEWARPEASQLDATADEDAAFASAWLQGDEPALQDLETAPLGLAGGNRPENPTQGLEKLEFAPGNLSAADHSAIERSGEPRPLAPHSASRDGRLSTPYARQEGRFADLIRGMRLGCLAADARPSPPAGLDAGLDREANPLPAGEKGPVCERPENPPQSLDKIESAPGIATGLETAATAPAGPLPPPGLFPALPKDANARSDVAVRSALRDTTRLASRLAVPEVWPAAPRPESEKAKALAGSLPQGPVSL